MTRRLIGMLAFATLAVAQNAKSVLDGTSLAAGFDMGVDTGKQQRDWLEQVDNVFRLSYPSNQPWGAVFITVGPPVDPPRPSMDFSAYKTLVIEMRGASGGETVFIGIKSNTQPDNGSEVKVRETLSSQWKMYSYRLEQFRRADLKNLYVVTEFVFDGAQPKTMYVRNIRYLP